MKPHIHAENSVRKYKGLTSDYIEIHNFMDSSKAVVPDMRHRCLFHSAFGCFIVEKVFGVTITNSDGLIVSTRDIAEDHIIEDLGQIPTLQDWLNEMNFKDWMLSPDIRKKVEAERKKEELANLVSDTIISKPETIFPDEPMNVVLDGMAKTIFEEVPSSVENKENITTDKVVTPPSFFNINNRVRDGRRRTLD